MPTHLQRRVAIACAMLPLSLPLIAAARPPSAQPVDHPAQSIHPDLPMSQIALRCAHPFESRGSYRLEAGYSGAGASSAFIPVGKFLQIRSLRATLPGATLSAGNLGATSRGTFAWYDLRVEANAVVYRASRDGALYADGGTRIKFVAYRTGGDAQPRTGDYVMRGCLVDSVPPLVTLPDVQAPHLPKKRLTPLEPVEIRGIPAIHQH